MVNIHSDRKDYHSVGGGDETTLPFDTIQYVGIPSRGGVEPVALDHVAALVQAVRKSGRYTRKYRGDTADLNGHRVAIFDLGQLANLSVATHYIGGGKKKAAQEEQQQNQLKPEDLLKILEPDQYDFLKERLEAIAPVAQRVIQTHEAIIRALRLGNITNVSVSSMIQDPEKLYHSTLFRLLIGFIWAFRSSRLRAGSQEAQVREFLFELIPIEYRRKFDKNRAAVDGYLSYGIVELAALIIPILAKRGDVRVFQYSHSREQTYLMVAQAILMSLLGVPQEEVMGRGRLVVLPNACGRTLDGTPIEADTYRTSEREVIDRVRLPVNPPPSLEELRGMLLNGGGRFRPNANAVVRSHIIPTLRRMEDEGLIYDERARIRNVTHKLRNEEDVAHESPPEDAGLLVEALFNYVIEPIRAELEKAGLIYQISAPSDIQPSSDDDLGDSDMVKDNQEGK